MSQQSGCVRLPLMGLGTWQSPRNDVKQAVVEAIKCGYRHIDCAWIYFNEDVIGEGLKEALSSVGEDGKPLVKREDLWITSKLWNTFHEPQHVREGFNYTLKSLGLDYIDIYLIHWPQAYPYNPSPFATPFPKDNDGKSLHKVVDHIETWREMEKLVDEGLVKYIGLSNFNMQQIQYVWDHSRIKPSVLQIEFHPYLTQPQLLAFAKEKNIAMIGFAPLGAPGRQWATPYDPSLFKDPVVIGIAQKYQKTIAQVLIRFVIDCGLVVIPKTIKAERIKENYGALSFELDKKDVDALLALNKNFREYELLDDKGAKQYPF